MDSLTITLPLPAKELSPNARVHWAKKSRYTRRFRELAHGLALQELNGRRKPRWERATAKLSFYFRTAARRDEDNALASCKAILDGLADAGLVVNDAGLSPRVELMAVDKTRPRLEVVIEETRTINA